MPSTDAIFVQFDRLSYDTPLIVPEVEAQWNDWYDKQHLANVCEALGAHTATRWRVIMPYLQVWYATVYDIEGAGAVRGFDRLRQAVPHWWAAGQMHPHHATVQSALVRPVAEYDPVVKRMSTVLPQAGGSQRLSPQTKGLCFVFTFPNNPAKEAEWNQWYMNVHTPEVIKTGGYVRATRCERLLPEPTGGNMEIAFSHLTIYDIDMEDVENAGKTVSRHKEWEAKGLMQANHSTGAGITCRPTGRWAGIGFHP